MRETPEMVRDMRFPRPGPKVTPGPEASKLNIKSLVRQTTALVM